MLIFLVSFALTEQQAEVNVEYLVYLQLLLTSNMRIVTLQVRAAN